jgi:hypothetical protein
MGELFGVPKQLPIEFRLATLLGDCMGCMGDPIHEKN